MSRRHRRLVPRTSWRRPGPRRGGTDGTLRHRRALDRGPTGGGGGTPRGWRRDRPSTPAATARSSASAAAARPVTARAVSTRASGSHAPRTAHWKRAASRVRRWEMPTTFSPASLRTSPGPRPAKQTRSDHARAHQRAVGAPSPRRRRSASAACHVVAEPARTTRPTSSSQSGSPAGTMTSTQSTSPGTTSTAPPPLRRVTTSTSTSATHHVDAAGCCRARAPAGRLEHPHRPLRGSTALDARGRRWAPPGTARPSSSRRERGGVEVGLPVLGHRADGDDRPR